MVTILRALFNGNGPQTLSIDQFTFGNHSGNLIRCFFSVLKLYLSPGILLSAEWGSTNHFGEGTCLGFDRFPKQNNWHQAKKHLLCGQEFAYNIIASTASSPQNHVLVTCWSRAPVVCTAGAQWSRILYQRKSFHSDLAEIKMLSQFRQARCFKAVTFVSIIHFDYPNEFFLSVCATMPPRTQKALQMARSFRVHVSRAGARKPRILLVIGLQNSCQQVVFALIVPSCWQVYALFTRCNNWIH